MTMINGKKRFSIGLMGLMMLIAAPALASDAYGNPFEDSGFVNQDWQVVCDNTLTCRAAGYADENAYEMPASILITANPKEQVKTAEIQLPPEVSSADEYDVELWLNDKFFGQLTAGPQGTYELNEKQALSLFKRAQQNTKIEIAVVSDIGSDRWQISDKGMASVLLKLDEVQGRVGTPLALVSEKVSINNPNRQTPKSLKSKPIIKRGYAYPDKLNKKLDAKTSAYFQTNMDKWVKSSINRDDVSECDALSGDNSWYDDTDSRKWTFQPINQRYTLAEHLCWRGAYNTGFGYWVIDNKQPSQPTLITTTGSGYTDGEILAAHKGRGLGDCWGIERWQWNGENFVRSYKATRGLCRSFAGGAWGLPTYVSEVVEPK